MLCCPVFQERGFNVDSNTRGLIDAGNVSLWLLKKNLNACNISAENYNN